MASTSSTPLDLQSKKWDVFISFRGEDTRDGFLSFLFKSLKEEQVNPFMDGNLARGEEISQTLLEIIEDSYVAVVIFSENYADSPWCLDELVKIAECREKSGQVVLPVFYKVDPADVQKPKGSFGMAFNKLKSQDCLHKVYGWSKALEEISNLGGWDSRNFKPESKLIEEIVKIVLEKLEKLHQMPSNDSYNDKLVGIDSRVEKVKSLLQIGLVNDHQIIGIWGMGGSGKTTIAREIFNQNISQFDSHCFINITEEIKNQTLIMLRDKIIFQLLREMGLDVNTSSLSFFIRRRLQMKKVIIVFDDVNDPCHLKFLLTECDLFNKGSKIIVTSRDRQVLKNVCPIAYLYEVEELRDQEALQLFCLHAFKQKHPREGFWAVSHEVIRYAQGNPLAIIVLGSNLYDKDMEEWESELKKLKNIPDMKIQQVLKISYDGLERNEKSIFLDIACFFKGKLEHDIERILEGCGFFPKRGMSRLVDKSLIYISTNGFVKMHDLLQQMGMDIVYEECRQPEGRSRLWNSKDISHILTKDKGTEKVEGILLNLCEIKLIEVSSTAFMKMDNLRFLKFYNNIRTPKGKLLLPDGLEFLPEELRYLQWDDYPLASLPLNFCPNNLVELRMPQSQLKQLWYGDEPLENLKVMDLSDSLHLIRIPDLSGALNLEVLNLRGCKSLVEIPSSIQYLSKLTDLGLEGCTNLCSLPSCLQLGHVQDLDLSGCSKLKVCADFPRNIKELFLKKTAIQELPSSVEHCSQLVYLSLEHCTRLVSLPPSINQLTKLEDLFCMGCDGLTRLPLLTGLSSLRRLDLGDCGILEIPESIGSLGSLECLYLRGNNFESIPASIKQLSNLRALDLRNCRRLEYLPELPCLKWLDASNCFSLKSASTSFLSSLERQSGNHVDTLLAFGNCINLDSKIIMDHVLEIHVEKQLWVKLCVPGVEAPEGMKYQNKNGSSLSNIRFDDRKIIGFSFCAVFHPKLFGRKLFDLYLECRADFKDKYGYILGSKSYNTYFNWHVNISAELPQQRMWLWYENLNSKERFTYASFQFYIYHHQEFGRSKLESIDKGIMKCGVHAIYENDYFVG